MDALVCWLLLLLAFHVDCQEETPDPELHPLDGWYNNLINPDWGAVDTHLLRKSKVGYADGVYHMAGPMRPNPFEISSAALRGPMGFGSPRGRNAMITYFGQQVVEEIMDSQRPGCPREFENIDVPKGHDLFDRERKGNVQLPFIRSRYDFRTGQSPNNPRQQISEITPYIDGQLMYGPAKAWTDAIREFRGGRLKALDDKPHPISMSLPDRNNIRLPYANPPNPRETTRETRLRGVNRFWRLGNPRGFENPFLLSFGVLWFRLHNYYANKTATNNGWTSDEDLFKFDERIFNQARKMVVGIYQKIVFYDWLPRWLKIENDNQTFFDLSARIPYRGYDPTVHPGITHEFQTSAMRFGHTLVTPGLWRRAAPSGSDRCPWIPSKVNIAGQPGEVHALRLCNAYWNSQESVTDDVDALFRGMASTLAEREDNIMVADLAGDVFGPLEFSRRDLGAINIQRARDHGLPDYQSVREAFGLPRLESFEAMHNGSIQTNLDAIRELKKLYVNEGLNGSAPNDVDLFVGGLIETTLDGPGPLFTEITLDQFRRIRDGDRFWYENRDNGLFNDTELNEINSMTLGEVIALVTNVKVDGQPGVNVNNREIQRDVFIHRGNGDPCPQPAQLNINTAVSVPQTNGINRTIIENCVPWQTYDYFSGSEVWFPLTFTVLALFIPATIGLMICMAKIREKKLVKARQRIVKREKTREPHTYLAIEWVGPNDGERHIKIKFDENRKKIHVSDRRGKPLRMIDLRSHGSKQIDKLHIWVSEDTGTFMSVRTEGEIDLVLKFSDAMDRQEFIQKLEPFLRGIGLSLQKINFKEEVIKKNATTKEQRQKLLDKFFRIICLQAFKHTNMDAMDLGVLDIETSKQIADIQLTRTEFAEALQLKPTSLFVRNMFVLVDADKTGFISFKEFLDFFVVLSSDDGEGKVELMFRMYDTSKRGVLTQKQFALMIKSLLELSDSSLEQRQLDQLVTSMYRTAGVQEGSDMTLDNFKKIFASKEYAHTLDKATLNLDGISMPTKEEGSRSGARMTLKARGSTIVRGYNTMKPGTKNISMKRQQSVSAPTNFAVYPRTAVGQKWYAFSQWVATYQLQIFWLTLYTLVLLGIFLERAFYYAFEREHAGLRRLAGDGVTTTRGAASAMMFTYSTLLITMSRNMITFFRETFLHRFFPWDSMHFFHKYIAALALIFTIVHCIGHGFNLYHISTQASGDLNCYFTEYFRATDVLASFQYWTYTTITGITGILATIFVIIIYVFAMPYARAHAFKAFRITHSFYIILYILMILHGSGRLVQPPLFQWYFIPPMIIFIIDKLISLSRNNIEITVKKAELLPSDVTALIFKRPANFEYKSGQWVRISCLNLGPNEYHPFTLTSAPHEENLSLHIRAVGPWTTNLRAEYDANNLETGQEIPKLYLDGPYGEGHQDWYRYKVAILVGGGIGVTPFASILKDIVNKSKIDEMRFPCKKVYFLWVTRTQKQFEWMTDIIREVEQNDANGFVDTHIFITQFQQKYDIRTTMLYICERHFQKVAGRSLFTGLSAVTHFGRPKMTDILRNIKLEHQNVNLFGVFSCGPAPLTRGLDRACADMNKVEGAVFKHHFENF